MYGVRIVFLIALCLAGAGTASAFQANAPADKMESDGVPKNDVRLLDPVPCPYTPGDVNGDGTVSAGDVTYIVRYFKGLGDPPPDSCHHDSIEGTGWLYAAADVSGNCLVRGADVTRLVAYFKATASLAYCALVPPADSDTTTTPEAIIADHTIVPLFHDIPLSVIDAIQDSIRILYTHTSHGSQIVTGLEMLEDSNGIYGVNNGAGTLTITERSDDLGSNGDTSWVPFTRQWLQNFPNYNVVTWSWCGGVSDNTEEGINIYLNKVNELEQDYPNVTFIYMTGHLDGSGPSGNLYRGNNQIRQYCRANGKVLFDFADIESYDPDGNYYPYAADDCAWCSVWCAAHSCLPCPSCAHSHCFNCYLKGKAFWWLLARIKGWGD